MPEDVTGFDPARDIRLDTSGLRALAHPLRVKLLGRLRLYGPATASQLASVLGESSGATSYHLRQLAAAGFVGEDPDRGTKRERWWKALHRGSRFDLKLDEFDRETGGEYMRAVALNYSDRMLRFADHAETVDRDFGRDWAEAYTLSDWALNLTPDRARELYTEVFALMQRFRAEHPEPAPGTRTVVTQFQLFPVDVPAPAPETVDEQEDS